MKISFSYDSVSNWLEYVLYSVFDIFWRRKKNYLWTAQQHCLFYNCCVHFEENIYCVFLEDKMKICSDAVQCFLGNKFPDTTFSYVRD